MISIFEILKMDPKLQEEIKACKNTEELKALLTACNIDVPGSKLEAVFKLSRNVTELNMEDLKQISGGCEPCTGW